MRAGAWILTLGLAGVVAARSFAQANPAQANIDPAHATSSSDWLGDFNWRPDADSGASINQYYCSGYIYGPRVGWISLGSGVPADSFHYKNNSAADYGINVMSDGALRGYAYGANIGWVNFEEIGGARVDWVSGRLQGRAWSANAGWINLDDSTQYLALAFLPKLLDSDGDGLPDAWEVEHTGNLTALSGNKDSDGDGQTDLEEYLAGTDPLNPSDVFGPVKLIVSVDTKTQTLQWPSKKNYVYRIDLRDSLDPSSNWTPLEGVLLIGTGALASISLPPNQEASLFYRVEALPPFSAGQWTTNP